MFFGTIAQMSLAHVADGADVVAILAHGWRARRPVTRARWLSLGGFESRSMHFLSLLFFFLLVSIITRVPPVGGAGGSELRNPISIPAQRRGVC